MGVLELGSREMVKELYKQSLKQYSEVSDEKDKAPIFKESFNNAVEQLRGELVAVCPESHWLSTTSR